MSFAVYETHQTRALPSEPTPDVAPENNLDSGRDSQACPWASRPPPFACLLCHHTQYHTVILTFNDILLQRAALCVRHQNPPAHPRLATHYAGICFGKFWVYFVGTNGGRAHIAAREKHTRTREQENIWNKYFLENRNLGLDFFTRGNVPNGLADSGPVQNLGGPETSVVQAPGTVDDGSTGTLKTEHISPFKILPAWG